MCVCELPDVVVGIRMFRCSLLWRRLVARLVDYVVLGCFRECKAACGGLETVPFRRVMNENLVGLSETDV